MAAYICRRSFLKGCCIGAISAVIPKGPAVYGNPAFDKVISAIQNNAEIKGIGPA